jgi:hypothetical protein
MVIDRPICIRDGSFFRNANPALRTGLLSKVPAGRILPADTINPYVNTPWSPAEPLPIGFSNA